MSDVLGVDSAPILIGVEEAARLLGVRRSLLYRLLQEGEIPSLTIGRCRRIRRRDLHEYVERRAVESLDSAAGY